MKEEEKVIYENVYKHKDYTKYLIILFFLIFSIFILIIIKKYK